MGRRDEEKYCAFHDANGHETADYGHLKDQIDELIMKGYLIEFVAQEAKKYKKEKSGRDKAPTNGDRKTRARSINMIF